MSSPDDSRGDDQDPDGDPDRDSSPHTLQDLPVSLRRRFLAVSVLRLFLSSVCLVIAYYVLPLDQGYSGAVAVEFAFGLLLVAGLLVFQARAISTSLFPRLRALMALGLSLPLFVLLFAVTYFELGQNNADAFNEVLNRSDALYFSVTVFSSVGFGDIVPRMETTRLVATVQMFGDVLFFGVAVRIIAGAVEVGLRRRDDSGRP